MAAATELYVGLSLEDIALGINKVDLPRDPD